MTRSATVLSIAVLVAVSGPLTLRPAGAGSILMVDKDGHASATDCDGSQPAYTFIQDAVNAAMPGSTILVCPGVYSEQVVVVTNNLTIRGARKESPVLRPSALPVDPGGPTNRTPRKAIMLVNGASGVTVANLTVDGSAIDTNNTLCPGPFVGFNIGIYYRNSSGTVASTHTTNVKSAVRCSTGILAESGGGATAKVDMTRNLVDKNGGTGVVCIGADTTCVVTENTIVGPALVAGLIVRDKAVARIAQNIVRGFVCNSPSCGPDPINQGQVSGVLLFLAGSGSRISENRFADNDVGISEAFSPDCCKISENRFSNNRFFGIVIQDGSGATSDNHIVGGQFGIGVVATSVDTTAVLRGDEITRTSVAPVREFACCGFKANAIVKGEAIVNGE